MAIFGDGSKLVTRMAIPGAKLACSMKRTAVIPEGVELRVKNQVAGGSLMVETVDPVHTANGPTTMFVLPANFVCESYLADADVRSAVHESVVATLTEDVATVGSLPMMPMPTMGQPDGLGALSATAQKIASVSVVTSGRAGDTSKTNSDLEGKKGADPMSASAPARENGPDGSEGGPNANIADMAIRENFDAYWQLGTAKVFAEGLLESFIPTAQQKQVIGEILDAAQSVLRTADDDGVDTHGLMAEAVIRIAENLAGPLDPDTAFGARATWAHQRVMYAVPRVRAKAQMIESRVRRLMERVISRSAHTQRVLESMSPLSFLANAFFALEGRMRAKNLEEGTKVADVLEMIATKARADAMRETAASTKNESEITNAEAVCAKVDEHYAIDEAADIESLVAEFGAVDAAIAESYAELVKGGKTDVEAVQLIESELAAAQPETPVTDEDINEAVAQLIAEGYSQDDAVKAVTAVLSEEKDDEDSEDDEEDAKDDKKAKKSKKDDEDSEDDEDEDEDDEDDDTEESVDYSLPLDESAFVEALEPFISACIELGIVEENAADEFVLSCIEESLAETEDGDVAYAHPLLLVEEGVRDKVKGVWSKVKGVWSKVKGVAKKGAEEVKANKGKAALAAAGGALAGVGAYAALRRRKKKAEKKESLAAAEFEKALSESLAFLVSTGLISEEELTDEFVREIAEACVIDGDEKNLTNPDLVICEAWTDTLKKAKDTVGGFGRQARARVGQGVSKLKGFAQKHAGTVTNKAKAAGSAVGAAAKKVGTFAKANPGKAAAVGAAALGAGALGAYALRRRNKQKRESVLLLTADGCLLEAVDGVEEPTVVLEKIGQIFTFSLTEGFEDGVRELSEEETAVVDVLSTSIVEALEACLAADEELYETAGDDATLVRAICEETAKVAMDDLDEATLASVTDILFSGIAELSEDEQVTSTMESERWDRVKSAVKGAAVGAGEKAKKAGAFLKKNKGTIGKAALAVAGGAAVGAGLRKLKQHRQKKLVKYLDSRYAKKDQK